MSFPTPSPEEIARARSYLCNPLTSIPPSGLRCILVLERRVRALQWFTAVLGLWCLVVTGATLWAVLSS